MIQGPLNPNHPSLKVWLEFTHWPVVSLQERLFSHQRDQEEMEPEPCVKLEQLLA